MKHFSRPPMPPRGPVEPKGGERAKREATFVGKDDVGLEVACPARKIV